MQSSVTNFVPSVLNDPSRPLLVHQVAKRLRLARRTVRHHAKTGALPARKIGPKIWQFTAADVEEFQAKRESGDD